MERRRDIHMQNTIDLRALQMKTLGDNSIEKTRKELTDFVDYMCSLNYQDEQRRAFVHHFKHVSVECIIKSKGFMCKDDTLPKDIPPLYREERFGLFNKGNLSIRGRFCFPAMSPSGLVMGLIAYDPFVVPKYYNTPTWGYKGSLNTIFGMELLEEYYATTDAVFIVEGLGCMLFLRDNGYKSVALLGSQLSTYQAEIITRFKNPIMVGDSDTAGNKLRVRANRLSIPNLVVPYDIGKDLDDARIADPDAVFNLLNFYRRIKQ